MHVFGFNAETRACEECGYKITAPFPVACPRCGKPIDAVVSGVGVPASTGDATKDAYQDTFYRMQLSKTIEASNVPPPGPGDGAGPGDEEEDDETVVITEEARARTDDRVPLGTGADYVKMMGVIDLATREIMFCSAPGHKFLLELGANAHDIASSILGGTLDRILFEPPGAAARGDGQQSFEEALFSRQGDLLYCIHGVFSKRPEVLLQGLQRLAGDVFKGKSGRPLAPIERAEIARKASSFTSHVVSEYKRIAVAALRRASIPTLESQAIVHYVGLSYRSIGTMSLLVTPTGEHALPIKDMDFGDGTADGTARELVESLISAKIEAIAANTLAGAGVFPRYIITKVGFDAFRVIEFLQLDNEYNLQVLCSGNVEVADAAIEGVIRPVILPLVDKPFSGQLTAHNSVKHQLNETLAGNHVFVLQP